MTCLRMPLDRPGVVDRPQTAVLKLGMTIKRIFISPNGESLATPTMSRARIRWILPSPSALGLVRCRKRERNGMMRLLFSLLAATLMWGTALAQGMRLLFDSYPPSRGTSVQFSTSDGGNVPRAAIARLPLRTQETQSHLYSVSVDTSTFILDKFQRFSFDAYVDPQQAPGTTVHKYTVSEDPIGPFLDNISTISFHIKGAAGEDVGTISLPLHSKDGSDNLNLALPDDPLKVGSGAASSSSELGLNNKLENLHVLLLDSHIRSVQCPECWQSLSVTPNVKTLAPQKGTSLNVERRPNTLKALARSMFMLNPKVPHDILLISVSSVSEQGGLTAEQEFHLPVRFTPPALWLAIAVVVGAVLGSLLRLWVTDEPSSSPPRRRPLPSPAQIGTTALIAIVIWLLALVLFSYTDTQVKILGFSFDPSQLPPAFLIALLAAGGPVIVKKIQEAFGK